MLNCSSATSTRVWLERFGILLESNVRGLASCHDTQTDGAQGAPAHKCPVELAEVALSTTVPPCISPYPQSRQGWTPHSGPSVLCSVQHYTLLRARIPPPFTECRVLLDTPADSLVCEGQSVDGNGDEVHRQTDATEILNTRCQTIITF